MNASRNPPHADAGEAVASLIKEGHFTEAERVCRQYLAGQPAYPERFHYALGFIFMTRREPDKAAAAFKKAVALAPRYGEAHHALAFALKDGGDVDGALAALQRAADCPGAGPEVHFNLGMMHRDRGAIRLSIDAFRRAVQGNPRLAAAWHALGIAYRDLNEIDEAIRSFQTAIDCNSRDLAPRLALGTLLLDLEREGAVEALAAAVALDPRSWISAERHARALARVKRFAEAFDEHRRACALAPHSGTCVLSYARSLADARRTEEADALCRGVIDSANATADEKALAHCELADRALTYGNTAPGLAALDAGLAFAPENNALRLRRAMLLLSLGTFEAGWKDFEARFRATIRVDGGIHAQPFPQRRWRGEDLRNQTILVWGEQGIGDDLVAASMLHDLAARARRVLVHTDARLNPLFTRSFPPTVAFYPRVVPVQPELLSDSISFQVPFYGLGEFLRPSWESFGPPRAYLRADPLKLEHFRQRYAALPGLKVGISWRSANLINGRLKSADLAAWTAILQTPGVTFVNLQYGDCTTDLAQVRARLGIDIRHDPTVDQLRDMDTFAAQVAALDLVISVSNAIGHTAGALGVPTCVLLATNPLWLWFRGRADSPWYPRARLFRQIQPEDWSGPIDAVAAMLTSRPPHDTAFAAWFDGEKAL